MSKKIIIIAFMLLLVTAVGYAVIDFLSLDGKINPENNLISPITDTVDKLKDSNLKQYDTDLADKDVVNILLLGIDRRSKYEKSFRTDIMIMVSINKANNTVVLVSIPRDLWYGGGRINAYYINHGFEGMQNAFEDLTGLRPDRYILTDFEDFTWIVDALGGVPVNVETSFTDSHYPVDATKGYQTVHFTQGLEVMAGSRALIFSRSRKGDNDNGDWGRMKRQHLLLKGIIEALTQPKSFICGIAEKASEGNCALKVNSKVITQALNIVTTGRMDTNFKVSDLEYLWTFYKNRKDYKVNSIYMDYNYLFTPPMSEYGGAWVLAPIEGGYSKFKKDISDVLYKLNVEEPAKTAPNDLNL